MNRKEEISKGCGKDTGNVGHLGRIFCNIAKLCPTCQARLDERIRAEQDFLKMLGELQSEALIDSPNYFTVPMHIWEELKSTIQKEKTE